jgi:hypothetical protein
MMFDFSNVNTRILMADTSTKLVVSLYVKRDENPEEKKIKKGWGGLHSVVCDSL